MQADAPVIVVVNAGSSSIKFALYDAAAPAERLAEGQISGIGTGSITTETPQGAPQGAGVFGVLKGDADHEAAISWLLGGLEKGGFVISAAGHRVVHGGAAFSAACRIDLSVEAEIERLIPLARLHNPHNLSAIRAVRAIWPELPQVACFDTAFHTTQPQLATTIALPQTLRDAGIRRYGFHGLSYQSVAGRLETALSGGLPERVIIAHLGNGASLCALKDGKSVATTMGFTPIDGLIMGTRPGLTDPGVLLHLMEEKGMNVQQVSQLLQKESGLLGLSGISADMRVLEASDEAAARFAIDAFCYRIVREAGSLAAALGGLDAFVFTGGIGENSSRVRSGVMEGLAWLGAETDAAANRERAGREPVLISTKDASLPVYMVRTDEEGVIAAETAKLVVRD